MRLKSRKKVFYNRVFYLDNCLNSIKLANKSNLKIEVCVSDNFSEENTEEVITKYKKYLNLNFNKNNTIYTQ